MHVGCGLVWERRKFGCGDSVLEVVLIALGRRKRAGVECGVWRDRGEACNGALCVMGNGLLPSGPAR